MVIHRRCKSICVACVPEAIYFVLETAIEQQGVIAVIHLSARSLLTLIVALAIAGCSDHLTRERALAIAKKLPGFSATTGSGPRPSNLRTDNIYNENSKRAVVQATFNYPIIGSTPDVGCTVRPDEKLEDCPLYIKMVYDGGWDIDKVELAKRQAQDDSLRRINDETAKQRKRLEDLRESNRQLQEEIKSLQSH
jgi:hypothetical protein